MLLSKGTKNFIWGVFAGLFFTGAAIFSLLSWAVDGGILKCANLVRFFAAQHFINEYYVNEADSSKLINGAIDGMVKSLDDQHSRYLDSKQYNDLKQHTEASFGGIGIVMGFKDSKVNVISVMEGTPGEAAGLRAGDEILAVDGVPVTKYHPDEVALHVRGEIGTKVVLTIARNGEDNKDYTIERASIHVKTAAGKMLEDNIGYIRISSFAEKTAEEFKDSLAKLESENMKSLIIDLRENPGGLVTSCVDISQTVVPKGLIVSVIHRDGSKEEYKSELAECKYPIIVLVNGNSASASEILAGALQDTKAAQIVGTKSYGKGSVQAVFPLGTGDAMKLTVAKYYTPSGRSIDGTGIEPDVKVEFNKDSTTDVQLEKALEILKNNPPAVPTKEQIDENAKDDEKATDTAKVKSEKM